jgi:nicotinamide-nucleotide amidase
MATGVRQRLGATYGLATTGVAGPDQQGGRPPGTVYVAVDDDVLELALPGDRRAVRAGAVDAVLRLLVSRLLGPTV